MNKIRASRQLIAASSTLVVIAATLCLWSRAPQERRTFRRTFISSADPKSGYAFRCTLSTQLKYGEHRHGAPGTESDILFFRRNSTLQRITGLYHPIPDSAIILMTCATKPLDKCFRIVEGYPELIGFGQTRIIKYRQLRIDGCPATFVISEGRIGPSQYHQSALLVHVPKHSMLYAVVGNADLSKFAEVDAEMEAIIPSFHIERIAVGAGGKR